MKSDIELIDLLKTKIGFDTDADLARYLGLTRNAIYMVRQNMTPLGCEQRLKIIDHLHYLNVTDWIQRVSAQFLSKRLADEIGRKVQNQALKIALPETEWGDTLKSDAKLLKLFQIYTESKTDVELANHLGLKRNSISNVRKGLGRLGLFPRVKILKLLAIDDTGVDELEAALESSDVLLEVVKKIFVKEDH